MIKLCSFPVDVPGKNPGWRKLCLRRKAPPPQLSQGGGLSHPLKWEEFKAAAPPPRYHLDSSLNLGAGLSILGIYGGMGLAMAETGLAPFAIFGVPIAAFVLGNVLYPPVLLAQRIYHSHQLPLDYSRILSFSLASEGTAREAAQAAKILRSIQTGDARERVAFSWPLPLLAKVVLAKTLAPADFDPLRKAVAEKTSDENALRKLALCPSAAVKEAVAVNFASPPDVLEGFVEEFRVTRLSGLAAHNPNAPARSVAVFLSNVFEHVPKGGEEKFLSEAEALLAIHTPKRAAILEHLQVFSSSLCDLLAMRTSKNQ